MLGLWLKELDEGFPPVAKNWWYRFQSFSWPFLFIGGAFILVSTFELHPLWLLVYLPIGVFFLFYAPQWFQGPLRKRVQSVEGWICTKCGHDLTGLPDIGECPRCSQPYNIETTIKAWKDTGFLQTHETATTTR